MHRVLVSEKICNEAIEYLMQNGIEVKIGKGTDEESIIEDIQDCDAVVVRLIRITKRVIDSAPSLRLIAKHGVGCDSIDVQYAREKGIKVLNTPGANSQSVAEHTVGLMLACAHQIVNGDKLYRDGRFADKEQLKVSEISEKTIGLIGCGRIARKVADILYYGFKMKVFGYDPYVLNESKQSSIVYLNNLEDVLKVSDFISLHLPLSKSTIGMVNDSFFKQMKRGSFLINTARGELIANDSLLGAILNGSIAGAALDATCPEPLLDSRLLNDSRIILTPHIGASSSESLYKMGMETANNIVLFFKQDDIL